MKPLRKIPPPSPQTPLPTPCRGGPVCPPLSTHLWLSSRRGGSRTAPTIPPVRDWGGGFREGKGPRPLPLPPSFLPTTHENHWLALRSLSLGRPHGVVVYHRQRASACGWRMIFPIASIWAGPRRGFSSWPGPWGSGAGCAGPIRPRARIYGPAGRFRWWPWRSRLTASCPGCESGWGRLAG